MNQEKLTILYSSGEKVPLKSLPPGTHFLIDAGNRIDEWILISITSPSAANIRRVDEPSGAMWHMLPETPVVPLQEYILTQEDRDQIYNNSNKVPLHTLGYGMHYLHKSKQPFAHVMEGIFLELRDRDIALIRYPGAPPEQVWNLNAHALVVPLTGEQR